MSITAFCCTNPERSFANWVMDLSLNNTISVELRFSAADPSEAKRAYLSIPAELESSPSLTPAEQTEMAVRRGAYFKTLFEKNKQQLGPKKESDPSPEKSKSPASVSKKESAPKLYQPVEFIKNVEKIDNPHLVKYGSFWNYSNFVESDLLTPYFLVEGWLVVSNATDFVEVPPFKFRNGDEVEIDPYELQCQKYNALKQQIQSTIKTWFKFERKKLWVLLATSFTGGLLFSAMVLAVRKSTDSVDKIQSNIFLSLCLFLQYVAINSGCTLYKLYELEFSVLHIGNVGLWVHQIRIFAAKYKDIAAKHPSIAKFFTPQEQTALYKQILYKA